MTDAEKVKAGKTLEAITKALVRLARETGANALSVTVCHVEYSDGHDNYVASTYLHPTKETIVMSSTKRKDDDIDYSEIAKAWFTEPSAVNSHYKEEKEDGEENTEERSIEVSN